MSQSNRGAAQVSLIWVIAFAVIAVVMAGAFFLGQGKTADELAAKLDAERQRDAAQALTATRVEELNSITDIVGFRAGGAGTVTNPAAVKTALEELATVFPSARDAKTLQETVPAVIADYNGLLQEKQALTTQVTTLRGNLTARQSELRTVTSEKDGQISKIQRDLEDTRTSTATTQAELERQRDAAREEIRDLDRRITEAAARAEAEKRAIEDAKEDLAARNNILSRRLNGVERAAATPDGKVITVSTGLRKAWIDLGRTNRIAPGVQFEVKDPTGTWVKGRLQVISVETGRAETRIIQEKDRYDPIAPGDLIINPLYDPNRAPIAVLLGDGFGRYSQEDMTNLLKEVGFRVRTEITNEVDHLILGTPYFDSDTGEEIAFSSMDTYKAAQAAAVQIVPLRDVAAWLGIQ